MRTPPRLSARAASALFAPCVPFLLALVGCGERDPNFDLGFAMLDPIALDRAIAYVETELPTAHVVHFTSSSYRLRRIPLGPNPTVAELRRGGHDELVVLSRGERDRRGEAAQPSSLTVIPGDRQQDARVYEIGSPFNAVAQSRDGKWAVIYFRQGADLERLLFNPNEIAIIDLDEDPSESNPIRRTVRSFGGVPLGVEFSPGIELAGEPPRTLALVLSGAYVTLLDLDHPERSEITVRLTLPEDPREIRPRQVFFEGRDIYIRAEASDDLYVLHLGDVPEAERVSNDYRPYLNQLATGLRPTDMALFDAGEGLRVLVASSQGQDAAVIDPRSNRTTKIPLAAAVAEIVLYEGTSPDDPTGRNRALLIHSGSATSVSFLDLFLVEERGSRNVESVQLGRPVSAGLPLPGRALVLLVHGGGSTGGNHGMSLLDLERRTAAPIYAEVALSAAVFGALGERLWVGPPSSHRLGWLDLATFHPGEIRLDAPIRSVHPLRKRVGDRQWVVVTHSGLGGRLSVVDAEAPERGEAHMLEGFLLEGILDGRVR